MGSGKILLSLIAGIDAVIRSLRWVAYIACAIMIIILVANVFGRFVINMPILGTIEIVEMSMVIIGFLAMPYAALKKAHVCVDLIARHLSKRTQVILSSFGFLASAVICFIITYQGSLVAIDYVRNLNQATALLYVPFAPFRIIMAIGFLLLSLKFLSDTFQSLIPEKEAAGGLNI